MNAKLDRLDHRPGGPSGTATALEHRLPGSGRSAIELIVRGRAPVPLLFVGLDSRVYVLPSDPPGDWLSAAVREGEVDVRWPDGTLQRAAARLRSGRPLLEALQARLAEKYGAAVWTKYFATTRVALELTPGESPPERDPHDRIRGEFDSVADVYDGRLAQQPVEQYLKERVADLAIRALEGLDPILEIGPGTGYHTLRLLAAGHRVVAVDISERMLEQLQARATAGGWADRLELRLGAAAELAAATRSDRPGSFGGAFSAFGALDLERDLTSTVDALARLVRPTGRFAFAALNRPGWSPVLWELAMARPLAAGARLRPTIPADVIRYPLTLYPRSPLDWDRMLAPRFVGESVQAVSVLAPPFDASRPLRLLSAAGARKLRGYDAWLANRRSAWLASEWLFLSYRRLGDPAQAGAAANGGVSPTSFVRPAS
ncbi:MAG TPA: methyltransferase domain-containing protein [Thermoplasmata archaeon]|nr:methyltransferase domain-containing protein [Thermoplasmata archaeon]